MKNVLCFLIAIFALNVSDAQKAVVANVKMNVAYIGLQNPIIVMVEGYKCDKLEVSTNNGTITKSEGSCNYNFIPKFKGIATIFVRQVGSKRNLHSFLFRTKLTPDPIFEIEPNKERIYHRKRMHPGIIYVLHDFDYDVRYVSQQYSFSIIRSNEIIFKRENVKGNLFEEISEGLNNAKDGDKLLFYDLIVKGPDSLDRKLSSVEFTVAE